MAENNTQTKTKELSTNKETKCLKKKRAKPLILDALKFHTTKLDKVSNDKDINKKKNRTNQKIEMSNASAPQISLLIRQRYKNRRPSSDKFNKVSRNPTIVKKSKVSKCEETKTLKTEKTKVKSCKKTLNIKTDNTSIHSARNKSSSTPLKVPKQLSPCTKSAKSEVSILKGKIGILKLSFEEIAENFTNTTLCKEINGIKNEFESEFPNCTIPINLICKESKINEDKNINKAVPLLNNARVIIKNVPAKDSYINANYVPSGNKQHRLIITQYPMKNTVEDFFQMIFQENVKYLIQLATIDELNNPLAGVEYIPKSGETIKFKNVEVTNIKSDVYDKDKSIKITSIKCKCNGREQFLEHILWSEGQQKGIPKPWELSSVYIYEYVSKSSTPIIIHCTSGVRRSGMVAATFMALDDFNLYKLKNNMIDIVKKLRNHRSLCIRTPAEYLFIHFQMIYYFSNKNYIENTQQVMEFLDNYERIQKKQMEVEKDKTNISAFGVTTFKTFSAPNLMDYFK